MRVCCMCLHVCVCVCGSIGPKYILSMVVARGQGRLCIVMGCGTLESKLGFVHSMLESATLSPYCQCPKDREAVSVKVEGPPYSCLLSTCLSSGSRIPIEILKSSISFSSGRDRVPSCCPFLPVHQHWMYGRNSTWGVPMQHQNPY